MEKYVLQILNRDFTLGLVTTQYEHLELADMIDSDLVLL